MGDVLIDLGEAAESAEPAPRPLPWRGVRIALALLLLASLAGAVHRGPPRAPTVVPARLSDNLFVTRDRIFVVGAGPPLLAPAADNRIVSSYALPSGRLESRTTVTVSGGIFGVQESGGTLLVSYQSDGRGEVTTVALTAGTARVLWRRPSRPVGVSAADSLVVLRDDRADAGDLWTGVDLVTGARRWSVRRPARGYSAEAGPDPAGIFRTLVSATADGRLELRDGRTGALTRSARVGPVNSLWPLRDELLVGGPGGTTAYGMDLVRRWRAPVDLGQRWVQSECGGVVCLFSPAGGMTALDDATGRELWSSDRWSYAVRAGDSLLAFGTDGDGDGADGDPVLAVLDPATGRLRGSFGTWQGLGPPEPDGSLIGLWDSGTGDVVRYARLDPATMGVRLLGSARKVGDCQAGSDVLVCRRFDATVAIFDLQ